MEILKNFIPDPPEDIATKILDCHECQLKTTHYPVYTPDGKRFRCAVCGVIADPNSPT